MLKISKKSIIALALAAALIQPIGTTPVTQAACMSIDSFLSIYDYKKQYEELKEWVDALRDMNLMLEATLKISIPCPGGDSSSGSSSSDDSYDNVMSDIGIFGSKIPSSWANVEATKSNTKHPIFNSLNNGSVLFKDSIGLENLQIIGNMEADEANRFGSWASINASQSQTQILSIPRHEQGNLGEWLNKTFSSSEEGAMQMGINHDWVSQDNDSEVGEIIFNVPTGLYKDEGFGWVVKDQFVISLKLDEPDPHLQKIALDSAMQEIYLIDQIKSKAKHGTNEYRIFLAGKSEDYLTSLIEASRAGDEESMHKIRATYRTPDYAENEMIKGRKYIALNDSIDSDLILMTRRHLRGLQNISSIPIEQEKVFRTLNQQKRGGATAADLRFSPDRQTVDLEAFFTGTPSNQDIDLLRHNYPIYLVLMKDLAYLRDNPTFRTGEFLLEGYSDPKDAVRIASILIGRTLDVDPDTVTLDPNAAPQFQNKGISYIATNNLLRDGLTRLTMAREYLEILENKKRFYTPESIEDLLITDLQLLSVRSELELHSIKSHILESQLRRERLLGTYMALEMNENMPELDYNPNGF